MIIIFDFDHTLFNTEKFKTSLAKTIGIRKSKFYETYKKFYNKKFGAIDYDLNRHLKILSSLNKKTLNKTDKYLNHINDFLKPGALDLLKNLNTGKHRMILLTAGNIRWQKRKLKNLIINKYFDKIIFARFDKLKSINNLKNIKDKIILINDNLSESRKIKKFLGRNCQVYIIKGKYSQMSKNNNFKNFHNLTQLNKFIIKNNL